MNKIKGREIRLQFLVKSAVAQKYYESLNMSYDTEAARKKFNQDWIDIHRLVEVMETAWEVEVEQIKALKHE